MSKRPQRDFTNAHENNEQSQGVDPLAINPDRKEGNTAPEPKPQGMGQSTRVNQRPPGIGEYVLSPREQDAPQKPYFEELSHTDNWVNGIVQTESRYDVAIAVDEYRSIHNLDSGRISALLIYKDGEPVANFEQGWELEPKSRADKDVVKAVLQWEGDIEREFKPIASPDHDKDRGHGFNR
ncbi:MAG: hypothetical protein JJ891_16100 [Rhizobiaceae bacterium]|jgi:hypothetical protein|nr:hypothetical protein [Rhizobiaceae bacterium]